MKNDDKKLKQLREDLQSFTRSLKELEKEKEKLKKEIAT